MIIISFLLKYVIHKVVSDLNFLLLGQRLFRLVEIQLSCLSYHISIFQVQQTYCYAECRLYCYEVE